jgi:ketosteroid isomerase-like protein
VYNGRDSVLELFERILEAWESLRAEPHEIRELGDGVYLVRGELHGKHSASATEVVSPYELQLEIRDRLLVKGRMATGDNRAFREGAEARAAEDSANVALVRRFLEAFNRLDIDSVAGDLDPAVELHEWPTAPGARTYRGHDGVRRALDSWFETWEWMQVEILDIFEVGDRVVLTLHQRAKGKASEVELEAKTFNVYTFRDGKVIRMEFFTDREAALEAAGMTANYQEEKR